MSNSSGVRLVPPVLLVVLLLAGSAVALRADEGTSSGQGRLPVLRVLVVHPDGTPVPGARVALGRAGRPAPTGANGRALLKPDHPGRHFAVLVDTPDVRHGWLHRHVESARVPVEFGYAEVVPAEVRLVVPRGGSLRVLLDRRDEPYEERLSGVEASLRRYYPDGTLWSAHDGGYPRVERLDAEGRRTACTFGGLPAGRYRLSTWARDRPRAELDVEVAPGAATEVSATLPDPAPGVELRYRGPLEARTGRQRFNVNTVDPLGSRPRDGLIGAFAGEEASVVTHALRPGRYVVLFWDLRLAMLAAVPAAEERAVDVQVPDALREPTGARTLTVTLARAGEPVSGLLVLLAPVRADPLAPGRWFRFARHGGPTEPFEGLSPGTYDVLVLDGALGGWTNLSPNPVVRRVTVGDADVDLRVDLP